MSDVSYGSTNHLTELVLDQIYTIRRLKFEVSELREAYRVAVGMLADYDKALDGARRQSQALREELRHRAPGTEAAA